MADFPSFATLFQVARNEVLVKNGQLSSEAVDRDGSDANILIAASARAADEVVGQLVNMVSGLYLDSAVGDALDRLVIDRYGLLRKQASSGQTTVTFTASDIVTQNVVINAGTLIRTASGVTYQTVYPETILPGQVAVDAVAVSTLAGVNQQVNTNTLTTIATTIPDAAAAGVTLTVTNALASSGAADRESDADYRARAQAFFTSSRRGTLSAIEQGALATPGVVRAKAFESLTSAGQPNGYVTLVIADQYTDTLASLNYPATYYTYAAQSNLLAQSVFNTLQEYRPAGVYIDIQVAQVVLQPIVLSLSFAAGVNVDTVALNARSAVVAYVNNLNPGDDLTIANIENVLNSVNGLVNNGAPVFSPSGDVVATPLQVFRTNLSLVRASAAGPGTPIGQG